MKPMPRQERRQTKPNPRNSRSPGRSGCGNSLRDYSPSLEALEDRLTPVADPFELSALLPPTGNGTLGFAINGIGSDDLAGSSVSSAGDVNGDGYDDVVVGVIWADPGGFAEAGRSYVIFGSAGAFSPTLSLSTLNGVNGFSVRGQSAGDVLGAAVSAAGDINGDGYDDILIGAPGADPNGISNAGKTYVIFGKASGFAAEINVASLNGTDGFAINGAQSAAELGQSIQTAGDVNADGFDDIILGSPAANRAYVVFGKASGFAPSIELASLNGSNGFALSDTSSGGLTREFGFSVSTAGDVNGDGFDDVIVGAGSSLIGNLGGSNVYTYRPSYVFFGKATGFASLTLASSLNGSNGFTFGPPVGSAVDGNPGGVRVQAAGDMNADGFDDIVITRRRIEILPIGPIGLGASAPVPTGVDAHILFGKASGFSATIDPVSFNGANGFTVTDAAIPNWINSGNAAGVGDVNNDGFDDLILGLPDNEFAGRVSTGVSYVVYGKGAGYGPLLSTNSLTGSDGFKIVGIAALDRSGSSVASARDVNGDGVADIIVGAAFADPAGISNAGQSYVIFGESNFTAVPGGPYSINETDSLSLTGSFTGVAGTFTYGWDLNGDNIFSDAFGPNPTVPWATLESLGLSDGPGIYNAKLKVSRPNGASSITPFSITINNAPPVISTNVNFSSSVRGQVGVFISTQDSTVDYFQNFLYEVDWNNDGTFDESELLPGNSSQQFTHTYTTLGPKTIRVRATDKDGGVSNIVSQSFPVNPYFYAVGFSPTLTWLGTGGDDEVTVSVIDATTIRLTETKVDGVVVNDIYNVTVLDMSMFGGNFVALASEGNDRIDLSGALAPLSTRTVHGGGGNDSILGSSLVDRLFGEAGNDTIYGAYGADYIDAGTDNDLIFGEMPTTPALTPAQASIGADTIYGGLGNDTIYGDSDGGEGKADLIYGDDGTGDSFTGGNDTIFGDGSTGAQAGADTIDGEGGNDVLHGDVSGAEGAPDVLYGGAGDDFINTGGGNDSAFGGTGTDILLGGDGAEGAGDTLDGGFGRDIVVGDGGLRNPKSKAGGADTINSDMSDIDLVLTGVVLPTETNPIDWSLIQAEWLRTDNTSSQKLANLTGTPGGLNGSSYLTLGVNVFDDVPTGGTPIVDTVTTSGGFDTRVVFLRQGQDTIIESSPYPPILVDLALYPRPA